MKYIKLTQRSLIHENLQNFIKLDAIWENTYGFNHVVIPISLINKDIFLLNIIKKFNGIPVIFHMKPNTFYRFHCDRIRKCTINMLISGEKSHCYFADPTNKDQIFENLQELIYESSTYYLLNTKKHHSIINFDNNRYMLSVGFINYSYETVKNYLLNNVY